MTRIRHSPTDPIEFRVFSNVVKARSGCWLWTGRTNGGGYGTIRLRGLRIAVHRWSYERYIGPVPEGMEIDHLCRTRNCLNPKHLEAVTHRTNLLRGETVPAKNLAKRRCPVGHEYTKANTYTYRGMRYCRECRRESNARRRVA